jgi:hypothetical protein
MLPVRTDADKLLRTYIHRNGSWQADPLMKGALAAAGDPAAGVAWILDLARSATDRASFLRWLARATWLPEAQRAAVYQAAIDAAGALVNASFGDARVASENAWRNSQIEYAEYLVNHQRASEAAQIVSSLPEDYRKQQAGQVASLDVRIAAQTGTLPALLERYRRDANPPPAEDLQRAANELSRNGNTMASRQVLEYLYVRQLEAREFTQAVFLGLAEIRLDQNDVAGAVTLLRRMTNVAGEPFENLTEAGRLLLRKGHAAEATEFLKARVQALPWDEAAKALLGRATADTGLLATVAGSSAAPYSARVEAARSLREAKAIPLKTSSAELNLLSSAAIAPLDAEKPYAYAARIDAATQATDPAVKLRLLRGAVAIDPSHTEDKVQIFKIAYAAKRYQAAVAALYPLHPFDQEQEPYEAAAPDFLPLRELADAYAKLGQLKAALYYYRADKHSENETRALEAQVEMQALNEKRRPKISAQLEQDHLILPRLKQGATQ